MPNLIYYFATFILTSGLFIMLVSKNYVHRIVGLGIFQSSVLIFYIAFGKMTNGMAPIDNCIDGKCIYSNPLPHVLMLTAIVVGFATLSVGLALIYRIFIQFGTVTEDEIELTEENDKFHS